MNRRLITLSLAASLSCLVAACDDGPPELPSGPIRGALLDANDDGSMPITPAPVEEQVAAAPEIESAVNPAVEAGDRTESTETAISGTSAQELPDEIDATPAPVLEDVTNAEAQAPDVSGASDVNGASDVSGATATRDANGELAATATVPAAAVVDAEAAPAQEQEAAGDDEILLVNFDDLSDFDYDPPTIDEIESDVERPQQIPDEILALNDKRVEIEGYMIPMEVEDGQVLSFILSRTLAGCCFGDMPNILEWIDVRMAEGETADYVPYAPVLVVGTLFVGESVDEYGITSVYRMTAESVEDPW